MWICSKFGFYSIVVKNGKYFVRARERQDLDNLINESQIKAEIFFDKEADYPFRLIVPDTEYNKIMECLTKAVDYPNFKAMLSTRADQKNKPYHEIWEILAKRLGAYVGFSGFFWSR